MNDELRNDLLNCETDLNGTVSRFSHNETLYISCLCMFLKDQTMQELDRALKAGQWDDAFTAAHALKGLGGNMGFVPLFHAAAELVMLIRGGRIGEIDASYAEVKRCYAQITAVIRKHCLDETKGE